MKRTKKTSKEKRKRKGIRMDMTAMVDVAFLLLTFFMLTTQFQPPEDFDIELPESYSEVKLPESDLITISIDENGAIYLGIDSQNIRAQLWGEDKKQLNHFAVKKEELPELLIDARMANAGLRLVLNSDLNAPYGMVEDIMNILQKIQITRFSLVTELEG